MGLKQTLITSIENTIFIDFLLKNGREISSQKVLFDVILPESLEQHMTCVITVWGAISFSHISVEISELREMREQINHAVKRTLERYKEAEKLEKSSNKFIDFIKSEFLAPEKLYFFKTQIYPQLREN